MKNPIQLSIIILLLLASACKKSMTPSPNPYASPQLILYTTFDYPPFFGHVFLITPHGLYEDSLYTGNNNFSFTAPALDSIKYSIAYPLLSSFPAYLQNDTGGNLGYPGPIGMGSIHFQYTNNNKTIKWNMPANSSTTPTLVQDYLNQVYIILPKLY
jgi:hypothetical protein